MIGIVALGNMFLHRHKLRLFSLVWVNNNIHCLAGDNTQYTWAEYGKNWPMDRLKAPHDVLKEKLKDPLKKNH